MDIYKTYISMISTEEKKTEAIHIHLRMTYIF